MLTWDDTWKVIKPILPTVAAVTSDVGGVLVGGTALAIHLQHRPSFDIDVQARTDFDSDAMSDRIRRLGGYVETTSTNYVEALLEDVRVEIWKSRYDEVIIEDGPVVAGIPVASLPDLFAMKLAAVVDRKQFRDFYDIATMASKVMTFLNGLRCYAYRYQRFLTIDEVGEVLQALQCPSEYIPDDPGLDRWRPQVLAELAATAEKTLEWLAGREGLEGSVGTRPEVPRLPL